MLPLTIEGFNSILIVIYKFSKVITLILSKIT